MRPWVNVMANIINTWCILMSETVTVSSFMMMTLIVFEESLAKDRHTQSLVYVNFFKDFENKKVYSCK